MILSNGVIRTMDPSLPTAGALAIAGDRIAGGVGTHESALPTPDRINLGGRCVIPGFTDAHVHFMCWSLERRAIRLEGADSLAEALDRVRTHERSGAMIRGAGWRDAFWSERPTAAALDAVTGDQPAALVAQDHHSLWLNSAALALAGGDLDVAGGIVEREPDGTPTGILREESAWQFEARFLQASEDEMVAATREGIRVANARGVVAIHDKDGGRGAPAVFRRIHGNEGLTLRVWQSLPAEMLPHIRAIGLRSGLGDDFLRVGYLKVFMDGTLGSQTASMLDGSGVEITSSAELEEIVREGALLGWPVSVHAIGDRANRDALNAFERSREVWAPLGLRPRIEHAQCLHADDIPRFAALGVAASVQFSHAPSDRDLAEKYWGEHIAGAYAFGSLVRSGAVVAEGSDAPVEELDPLRGLRAGITRTLDARPGWRPEEALTAEQALHAATVAPAWLAGDERRRGKLLPGYLADLVVLSRDPITCPLDEVETIEIVATMVGGRWAAQPAALGLSR